jgi:glycosyltransferase involved in cell wall biosynthesis
MKAIEEEPHFEATPSVTVILPVLSEVEALETTLEVVLRENPVAIDRIVVVVCDRTDRASIQVVRRWESMNPNRVHLVEQTFGGLGGALRTGIEHVRGSHAIMMFADLESDPHEVKHMIAASLRQPNAIVSASRWLPGAGFEGYGRAKIVGNWCFQKVARLLHPSSVTDFTFGYRLYSIEVLRRFDWRCENHEFVLESLLRPLRAGCR